MADSKSFLRVRYVETDQMGIVHHSVYFHWMEVGRADYLRERGLSYAKMEEMGIRMPVVEAKAEFISPAKYDDEIVVRTSLAEKNRISFAFDYEIARKADGILLAKGTTRHVATDGFNRPRRVPTDVFKIIGGSVA
ncbi:MAG TPA: thioesterase family protein [Acidobacteriota bacterium]|jgi:acyl-CoA thioester hydrolase|nr:thioesterase family protein [Acidobacteriota bacterium]HNT16305.1 thioesterase family protein [Acidobacteriota bacterium]HPA26469.1 thioesterase family protein [Acidobacteriota bacterium]HQO18845.1 thioesterase family protein [Acidobacteriota bacterium]HQQ47230.1 thioesterase family protein [Acidobacteriota bacterium]